MIEKMYDFYYSSQNLPKEYSDLQKDSGQFIEEAIMFFCKTNDINFSRRER